EAENAGPIRNGARALAAIYQARVPFCAIILRKVFGVAGAGHTPHHKLHYRYAWPSGDWGSLPVEGGIEAAYRADLDAAPDRDKRRHEIEGRLNQYRSPFRTAETFLIEEIIDPRDTRPCCANSPIWRPSCASRAPSQPRCGLSGFELSCEPPEECTYDHDLVSGE